MEHPLFTIQKAFFFFSFFFYASHYRNKMGCESCFHVDFKMKTDTEWAAPSQRHTMSLSKTFIFPDSLWLNELQTSNCQEAVKDTPFLPALNLFTTLNLFSSVHFSSALVCFLFQRNKRGIVWEYCWFCDKLLMLLFFKSFWIKASPKCIMYCVHKQVAEDA